MYSEAVDDEKLRMLAFEDRWHYVAILCLKSSGLLDEKGELRDRKIALKLGLSLQELDTVKKRLREVGLIDAKLQPLAWDKRQYKHDNSAERVRAYRERKKADSDVTTCNGYNAVTVTGTEAETETDTEIKTSRANALPDWLPKDIWHDFKEHRQKLRKPFTKRAEQLAIAKLERLSDKPSERIAIINQSIESGWSGLFALKTEATNGRRKTSAEQSWDEYQEFLRSEGRANGDAPMLAELSIRSS